MKAVAGDHRSIRLHWSWGPALAVLVWLLIDHFPRAGVVGVPRIGLSVAVSLLALGSVVTREIARLLAASRLEANVGRATMLWPAGGVWSPMHLGPLRADLRIAGSGLITSFLLAALFFGCAEVCRAAQLSSLAQASDVLARFNAAFGIFDLVPALPFDGGALLRSWRRSRGASPEAATRSAIRAGVVFGILLTVLGAARIAAGDVPGGIGLAVAGVIVGACARAHGPLRATLRTPARAGLLRRALSGIAVAVAMLLPAATLYHPPLALMSAGAPLNVLADITIGGAQRINGRYLAASVQIQSPSALHAFVGLFRQGIHVVRRSEVPPVTEDPFRASGGLASLFRQSRVFAAVAAAKAVGLEATVRGTGARIVLAGTRARAAGIRPGDVIVSVDGRPVRLVLDVRDAVTSRSADSVFSLGLERGGQRFEATLRSKTEERSRDVPGLDVILETRDFAADLPFDIEFGTTGAGGPSAGLAYALAIADLLDPRDLAAGRTIAATGIVDLSGRVDPIVGARAKLDSALGARADVFVLPFADAASLRRARISLLGVDSLDQALSLLRVKAADGG